MAQSAAGAIVRSEGPFAPGGRTRLVLGFDAARPVAPDGYFQNARLDNPLDLAFAPDGKLVVAEHYGNTIRLITPDGWATTIAGAERAEQGGKFADGPGGTARFANPSGVAVAKDGTIYVSDTRNHVIRRLRKAP